MFNSWTITKTFTPIYTTMVNASQPVVRADELEKAEFVADDVNDWKRVEVDMRKYWGSVRGTNSY